MSQWIETYNKGSHRKFKKISGALMLDVGTSNTTGWSWGLLVDTGCRYDDEEGEVMRRQGEEVAPEDIVWRVITHGRERSEEAAKKRAELAAATLRDHANELASGPQE